MDETELAELMKLSPAQIVEQFRAKGYAISWSWRDVWKEANAEAFTVAKATQLDVLADLRRGVQDLLDNGTPKEQWMRQMEVRMRAAGWWGQQQRVNPATGQVETVRLGSPHRLETIYRTNAQVSFQRGRYNAQRRLMRARPYWQYIAVMDSRTRHSHALLNGHCYEAASRVWETIYPPNGYNCRCRVRALTKGEVARKGIEVEDRPDLPAGFPDDGWDFNAAAVQPRFPAAPYAAPAPDEIRDYPQTAQLGKLVELYGQASQRAIATGIDVALVGTLSAQFGAFAPLPGPPDLQRLEADAEPEDEDEP